MIDFVVVTPERVHDPDPIVLQLTGFQFADVDAVTDIQYDIQPENKHVDVPDFGYHDDDSNCEFRTPSCQPGVSRTRR